MTVMKWWKNDSGTGFYCRVHGTILDSDSVKLEVICSVSVATDKDDVDLFILLNGTRLVPVNSKGDYWHRDGDGPFRLVSDDAAYEVQTDLESLLLQRRRNG